MTALARLNDGFCYDAEPNLWRYAETTVSINDEDMPDELLP